MDDLDDLADFSDDEGDNLIAEQTATISRLEAQLAVSDAAVQQLELTLQDEKANCAAQVMAREVAEGECQAMRQELENQRMSSRIVAEHAKRSAADEATRAGQLLELQGVHASMKKDHDRQIEAAVQAAFEVR